MRVFLPVSLAIVVSGCGSKMPVPPDLQSHAMELSVSGPPTSLSAGPFAVRAFRDVSEQEASSVLGPAKAKADRTFAFELAQGGEALRKVACRGYKRPASAIGDTADEGGLSCAVGTAGGNAFGRLTLVNGSRGQLRLGSDSYTLSAEGAGTVVRKETTTTAAWQYSSPRTAWLPANADRELQASMVSAMAAMVVYRDLIAAP